MKDDLRSIHARTVRHALVLGERDFKALWSVLEREYADRSVRIRCADGSAVQSGDIGLLLNWDNTDARRIERVNMSGTAADASGLNFDETARVELRGDLFGATVSVHSADDSKAEALANKLTAALADAQPDYDRPGRVTLSGVYGTGLALMSGALIFTSVSGSVPADQARALRSALVFGVAGWSALFLALKSYWDSLCPRLFFRIGRQEDVWTKLEVARANYSRHAIIASVLSSVIASAIWWLAVR